MNRLTRKLGELQSVNRKALSIFITAGFPDLESTVGIVRTLGENGADFIELGIPFSDPLADGPTIQKSSDIALRNGVTIEKVFGMLSELRSVSDIPVVLMGYVNPLLSYGVEKFAAKAAVSGADGLIVPDLPPEESAELREAADRHALSTIFLAAPTTPDERLRRLDEASTGFLYCVSMTGVTGRRNGLSGDTLDFLKRCRRVVKKNPTLAGFGISGGSDAAMLAPYCDGIIVGSALIKTILAHREADYTEACASLARELRKGLDESIAETV